MERERIKSLDFLKGAAIFLVFVGHAIYWCNPDAYHDRLFNYIYSFHMPLFMFISGFFSFKLVNNWNDIKKKFYQLIVPILSYSIVAGFIFDGGYKVSKFVDILLIPERGLWFLQVLFFISVFFIVANILYNKVLCGVLRVKIRLDIFYMIALIIAFSISALLAIYCKKNSQEVDFGTALFSKHSVYFFSGIITRMHWDRVRSILSKSVWLAIPVWFVLASFFEFQHKPTFIERPGLFVETFYYYLTGFSGIVMALSLTDKFIKQETTGFLVSFFSNMGTMTLGLYAVHSAFLMKLVSTAIRPFNLHYLISLVVVTVVTLFLSILCVRIFERGDLMSQLFLGKKRVL